MLRPGDRVLWSYLGKTGDTGTVVKVTSKRLSGGSTATVRVKWDLSGHVGAVEDRVLARLVKTCGCGRSYTQKSWEQLPFVGEQLTEDETGKYRLEMRNCACRSTIGTETQLATSPLPRG